MAAAMDVDQVVNVAALGPDWETEGHDRVDVRLPGEVDRLIAKVGEVNPNTVGVLHMGTPVEMPWVGGWAGVLQAWCGGNESGNAVADVLLEMSIQVGS